MGPARRACDWEQGERVPRPWDLVAAVWVRPDNTRQATDHQLSAFGLMAETDDGNAGGWLATVWTAAYRIGGTTTCLYTEERGCVWASRPPQNADVAELADAIDLGSIARQGVEVRVLSSALLKVE